MDYEEIKSKVIENKQKLVLLACFVLVFFVGFGTGRSVHVNQGTQGKVQTNYTTNKKEKPLTEQVSKEVSVGAPAAPVVAGTSTPASTQNCTIKGNISTAGRKIYHVKGGAFYDRVKAEQCFATEAEAVAAGFVKSQR